MTGSRQVSSLDQPLVHDRFRTWTRAALAADPLGARTKVALGSKVAVQTDSAAVVIAAVLALDGWAGAVHLLPPGLRTELPPEVVRLDLELSDRPAGAVVGLPGSRVETRWVLYTSGTTGLPTSVEHSLASLTRTVRSTERTRSMVWGLLYNPTRMAGLQVLLQVLSSGALLVAPDPAARLSAKVAWMRDRSVTALSATPTLWRQMLQSGATHGWALTQLTLGGEIADQKVLDALAAEFPGARVTHVFASTETGAAFGVRDGLAGFPASYLEVAPGGIRLRIVEGILQVHSPAASVAGPDGFASTGDVVEVSGDRVLFRGRSSGIVNVGGSKVWPEDVERLLRTHPHVLDAVVSARVNAFTGSILVATIVPGPGAPGDLAKTIRAWVKTRAPGHHVPAIVTAVPALAVSSAGKAERR
ncbi:AMP-binding protein [Pengzhenrongella sicca]|uniref:AMP-binding protein n=1 Tax=Pengzhenrongella sicca TaxID=2819238 RepID=A0A8A4ZEY5_9MICO|nr:AMP-binding protein [Pengzhenrongella sicca]QTE29865.1 AMP-binding protein [Pengzhenrongella sicca]